MKHTFATLLFAAPLGVLGCGPGPSPLGDDTADAGADPDADPYAPDAVDPRVPPEVDGRLTINELMPANALTVVDDVGVPSDWIEIYNPTDQDLSLHGYGITDDLADPLKHTIAEGVVVPAGGYVLLWADDDVAAGAAHLGFKLRRETGTLGLARPDGSWIDRVSYGEQETDLSAARQPDGSDAWVIQWHPTPGAANAAGTGAPMGLEDAAAPPEQVPSAGDLTERILGYDEILEIAIDVPPEGVAALEAEPYAYVPGTITYRGRAYGPVGVRLKGGNSFQPFHMKPSFRINIDEYAPHAKFFGLDDLTLNNMDNDLSMMHERLAYLIARRAQLPASRANHALVTVNGQFYGLYTNVETVKRHFLSRWFADDTGPLFEGTDVDFTPAYTSRFQLESGPDDRSLLAGLAQALTASDPNAAIAAAAGFADMAQFRRYWATMSVIGQFDAMPYSNPGDDFHVYADPTSGRLHFIPWGMDESFYASTIDVTEVHSILARKCKDAPACFQAYADAAWDVLALVDGMDILAERDRVAAQIRPYVEQDTRKPYTTEQVLDSQSSLRWFLSERRARLTSMLPPPSGE